MRIVLLVAAALGGLTATPPCVPLIDKSPQPPESEPMLGVVINVPHSDITLPQGATLTIRWTAYNTTDKPASARLYVEARPDLTQTVLVDALAVSGTVTTATPWDTTQMPPAKYVIYAEITAGTRTERASASGRVKIDAPPSFAFTQPASDATYTQGGDALTIAWTGSDHEGNGEATIGLDADTDHQSGNEIFLHEVQLTDTESEGSFDWTGNSLTGEAVPEGTYYLFALVRDDVNPERVVEASARISIVKEEEEEPEQPLGLGIVAPDEDTDFLFSDDPLRIEFSVNRFEDTLIDLKIDTDDNHSNGNEITILSQRLVPGGTETDTFNWDGSAADGSRVPAGIYRIVIVANTGGSTPTTAESSGLVFRREVEDQPLIALLEPATQSMQQAGGTLRIRWRDDDPTGSAKIRLMLDDDPNPNEGETGADPDDMAELLLVDNRDAAPDGDVHDQYHWTIPRTLAPGIYYVFGYIRATETEPGGQLPNEQFSVAPGILIIRDPTNP
jgi:flagellar hook assembly protein FlgD